MDGHRIPGTRIAQTSAVLLAAATVWTVLIELGVTAGAEPTADSTHVEDYLERFYAWTSASLPQERGAFALLCLGLVGVLVTAVRPAVEAPRLRSVLAAIGIAGGAALWAVAGVAEAGAQRAVEQMAAAETPIDPVNTVAYTVDVATGWLYAGACLALSAGFVIAVPLQPTVQRRVFAGLIAADASLFAVLVLTQIGTSEYAALALGGVLLPAWIAWSWLDPRTAVDPSQGPQDQPREHRATGSATSDRADVAVTG